MLPSAPTLVTLPSAPTLANFGDTENAAAEHRCSSNTLPSLRCNYSLRRCHNGIARPALRRAPCALQFWACTSADLTARAR